jgi:hypothetical protein
MSTKHDPTQPDDFLPTLLPTFSRAEYRHLDVVGWSLAIIFTDRSEVVVTVDELRWLGRGEDVVFLPGFDDRVRWWHKDRWWNGVTDDPHVVALVKRYRDDLAAGRCRQGPVV